MNSGTVLAGTDGFTTITFGTRMTPAIGTMSRIKLKLRLSWSVALIVFAAVTNNSVYPSGTASAAASAAILLPAPGRFSMMNDWPSRCDSH